MGEVIAVRGPQRPTRNAASVHTLLQLAVDCHGDVEHDPGSANVEGRRDAFLLAAAVVARDPDADGVAAATSRLRRALEDGISDAETLAELITPAAGPPIPTPTREGGLDWVSRRAFEAAHGGRGIDEDFGMRWVPLVTYGSHGAASPGADDGLLFAYEGMWDEYAVLADSVRGDDVRAAYHEALDRDPVMGPAQFTPLLHSTLARHAAPGWAEDVGVVR